MEGVAEAASWSAVFAMLLQMFPENVATVYSVTEACFAFAEMIGPTFGAFLYEYGGFALPFLICGSLCLITGFFTIFVLPKNINNPNNKKDASNLNLIDSNPPSVDELEMIK